MKTFDEILSAAFADADLSAADVPRIDLYMDQILTLVRCRPPAPLSATVSDTATAPTKCSKFVFS